MKRASLLLMVLLLLSSCRVMAANWIWILSTDTTGYYLSEGSVIQVGKYPYKSSSHYTAWIKTKVEDPAERQKYIDTWKTVSNKDFSNFYYTINKEEFDYRNGTIYRRLLCNYIYDFNDNVIDYAMGIAPWLPVPPDSIGEYMYLFCKKYAK